MENIFHNNKNTTDADADTKKKIEDLTSFMVRKHYCENDTKALIGFIGDTFSWFGAGENEYAVGAENAVTLFRQFTGKIPSCLVSDEQYDAIRIADGVWICTGRYWVQTDPSTKMYLRVHQRITAVFKTAEDGSFRCSHIHISNPYSEMEESDVGFPTQMANRSREYLREQIALQKKLIDKQTQRLIQLSFRDTMTGLYNRNKFNQVMHKGRCTEDKNRPLGIAYFDLNGLKEINDRYGHDAGDKLIVKTASHLNRLFFDKTYRIGGDEFVVIDRESDEETFRRKVDETTEIMKNDGITIAVGVCRSSGPEDITKMFHEADRLMYEDKQRFYRN